MKSAENKKTIEQLGPVECTGMHPDIDPDEGIIEYIYRGGEGDEAIVSVELRTVIPGISQVI